MKMNFKAEYIYSARNTEDEVYEVGFTDKELSYENFVLLAKDFENSKEYSDLDIAYGMDGYYFEFNDQEYSSYQACKKVVLIKDKIVFYIDNQKIENIEEIEIDLSKVIMNEQFIEILKIILGEILEIK